MPTTAILHFREDINRARGICSLASALVTSKVDKLLRDDLLRCAWMFGVGAFDAYFCDAFGYCIQHSVAAKRKCPAMVFPSTLVTITNKAPNPTGNSHDLRIFARGIMESQSVLSIKKVNCYFSQFAPPDGFFHDLNVDRMIVDPRSTDRLWGTGFRNYLALPNDNPAKVAGRSVCAENFKLRMQPLLQRRNDCIHNCDRPKLSLQRIQKREVEDALHDIDFFVSEFDQWINDAFISFLGRQGCSIKIARTIPR
jgi:hypothetical protein